MKKPEKIDSNPRDFSTAAGDSYVLCNQTSSLSFEDKKLLPVQPVFSRGAVELWNEPGDCSRYPEIPHNPVCLRGIYWDLRECLNRLEAMTNAGSE
jgi:hypothetical protein